METGWIRTGDTWEKVRFRSYEDHGHMIILHLNSFEEVRVIKDAFSWVKPMAL